jgi:hypothetical protein
MAASTSTNILSRKRRNDNIIPSSSPSAIIATTPNDDNNNIFEKKIRRQQDNYYCLSRIPKKPKCAQYNPITARNWEWEGDNIVNVLSNETGYTDYETCADNCHGMPRELKYITLSHIDSDAAEDVLTTAEVLYQKNRELFFEEYDLRDLLDIVMLKRQNDELSEAYVLKKDNELKKRVIAGIGLNENSILKLLNVIELWTVDFDNDDLIDNLDILSFERMILDSIISIMCQSEGESKRCFNYSQDSPFYLNLIAILNTLTNTIKDGHKSIDNFEDEIKLFIDYAIKFFVLRPSELKNPPNINFLDYHDSDSKDPQVLKELDKYYENNNGFLKSMVNLLSTIIPQRDFNQILPVYQRISKYLIDKISYSLDEKDLTDFKYLRDKFNNIETGDKYKKLEEYRRFMISSDFIDHPKRQNFENPNSPIEYEDVSVMTQLLMLDYLFDRMHDQNLNFYYDNSSFYSDDDYDDNNATNVNNLYFTQPRNGENYNIFNHF